jgi:plasmid stabilization system protein ParE
MKVEFSSFVEGDLDVIADYIAQDNPKRAVTFLHEIGEQVQRIAQKPTSLSGALRTRRRSAYGCCGKIRDSVSNHQGRRES